MSQTEAAWSEALRASAAAVGEDEVAAGEISVAARMKDLAGRWPGDALAAADADLIDMLCRKVHVAGGVRAVYRKAWKRKKGAPLLGAEAWDLLLRLLLTPTPARRSSERAAATWWKQLNAALTSIDQAAAAKVALDAGLAPRAAELLAAEAGAPVAPWMEGGEALPLPQASAPTGQGVGAGEASPSPDAEANP